MALKISEILSYPKLNFVSIRKEELSVSSDRSIITFDNLSKSAFKALKDGNLRLILHQSKLEYPSDLRSSGGGMIC